MKLELSAEEQGILEELLDKELKILPVEIHHTRTSNVKDYLKEKQKKVESLYARMKA